MLVWTNFWHSGLAGGTRKPQNRQWQLLPSSLGALDATSEVCFPLWQTEARQHKCNEDVASAVCLSCCSCPWAGTEVQHLFWLLASWVLTPLPQWLLPRHPRSSLWRCWAPMPWGQCPSQLSVTLDNPSQLVWSNPWGTNFSLESPTNILHLPSWNINGCQTRLKLEPE